MIDAKTIYRLADEALRGPESDEPTFREFFSNPHFRKITHGFSYPSYHPLYPFLFALSRNMKPKRIVELGVELGRGLICMHLGSKEAEIIGVDIMPSTGIPEYIGEVAVDGKWRVEKADSVEFAEKCPRPIDLLHIDTTHTYVQVHAELTAYRPLMSKGGVIAIDDSAEPGIATCLRELCTPPEFTLILLPELHPICGYSVCVVNQ